MFPFFLGQQAPTVDSAIGWAERASQLGVAGICLFVMFLALYALYQTMRKNSTLSADLADKERGFREELGKKQDRIAELERGFRTDTERLLREMIERGEDASEVLNSNTQALKDMTSGLSQLTTRIEYIERKLNSGGGVG